jgi:hypothetical protein
VGTLKVKISIMSLINDLGINKVPKENKNKNNTFQILENIILIKEYHFGYENIQNSIWIEIKLRIISLNFFRVCNISIFAA